MVEIEKTANFEMNGQVYGWMMEWSRSPTLTVYCANVK